MRHPLGRCGKQLCAAWFRQGRTMGGKSCREGTYCPRLDLYWASCANASDDREEGLQFLRQRTLGIQVVAEKFRIC